MGWDVAGTSPCIPVQMEAQPGRKTPPHNSMPKQEGRDTA